MVPTGEIPRTFSICVDRHLAGKLNTGSRVQITGIYMVLEQKMVSAAGKTGGLKLPFIRVLG
jgi:DNA replicative helicase MCM subunit Mcm2 (Cdc46/Mcm family)